MLSLCLAVKRLGGFVVSTSGSGTAGSLVINLLVNGTSSVIGNDWN